VAAKHERILGIHVGLVVAEVFCCAGFTFELYRANSGNSLSWAYVFEWPIFAGYAIYMWRRLLREAKGTEDLPSVAETSEPADQALERYNDYLRAVHDRDDQAGQSQMRTFNG
jgi:hypothetical protein